MDTLNIVEVNVLKGEELLKYKSIQTWLNSLDQMAVQRGKDGLTKNAKAMRLGRMWNYTNKGILNPDELLKEAQENIDNAGKRLKEYFIEKKAKTSHNTAVTSVGFIRGFYTHNDVSFPKKWGSPRPIVSKVAKQDEKTSLYQYNEKNDEIEFKNGNLQHFMQNLNFRDQTIALGLLSTGADATDILNLKVGFVKDGFGDVSNKKRFFWHGNRAKTGQPFKTFFSEEATQFLKRYVKQERVNASDDELLFSKTNDEPYTAHLLSINFRNAAKKMGYTKRGQASPFRPKRFRHLFRTACAIAQIDNGFTMAFMGHASDVSSGYLEQNSSIFEKMYVKIEPLLTVFGTSKSQVNEMSREISGLKDELTLVVEGNKGVTEKTAQLENEIKELKEQLECAVNYIWSLKAEIEEKEKAEAEEDFRKLVEEINKEHPIPKKVKSE